MPPMPDGASDEEWAVDDRDAPGVSGAAPVRSGLTWTRAIALVVGLWLLAFAAILLSLGLEMGN